MGSRGAGSGRAGISAKRAAQLDYLENTSWGGSGKAINPNNIKKGDVIDLEQYKFNETSLKPTVTKGMYKADYNGTTVRGSVKDVSMKVTDVKVGKTTTTITGEKMGGAPMTITKEFPNDVYLRTFGRKKK